MFLRRLLLTLELLVFFTLISVVANASPVLWYNGDFDQALGVAQGINVQVTYSCVYDDFIVTGPWVIDTIWSNNLMDFTGVTEAFWEIRSGISAGDGGTLIANGTGSATQAATGRSGFELIEYTIEVSGLDVSLSPGRYWLTVAPVGFDSDYSFISRTSGNNAIGTPSGNNQNAFINSRAHNFESLSELGLEHDFSMGVKGTVVPEPMTFSILAIGILGLGYMRRRGTR